MDKIFLFQVGNVLAYIFMLVMKIIGTFFHFHKKSPEQIHRTYPVKFMPSEWTFYIWYLILALLGIFVVYQALGRHRIELGLVDRINVLFIINALASGIWVLGFGYEWIWVTTICSLIMLVTLIVIYIRLWAEKRTMISSWEPREYLMRYWLVEVPFSVYLGWMAYEFVVNISVQFWADPFKWRENVGIWVICLMVVLFGVGLLILWFYDDFVFVMPLIWGFAGLAHRQSGHDQTIFVLAIVLAVFLAFAGCFGGVRKAREYSSLRSEVGISSSSL
jgi:hypothetical protein